MAYSDRSGNLVEAATHGLPTLLSLNAVTTGNGSP